VAGQFADLLDVFVLDDADEADEADEIAAPGVEVRVVPTVVAGDAVAAGRLARVVLGVETR
jgi:hypothetical protein